MWRWINPHNHRYYQADLVLDLFGDWTLVCAWGGLGTLRGGHSITGVSSRAAGLQKIEALGVHREKRGYVPVTSFAGWAALMEKSAYPPPEKLIQSRDIPATEFVLEWTPSR
jgi:predicted DNA-binding WGR domain protein